MTVTRNIKMTVTKFLDELRNIKMTVTQYIDELRYIYDHAWGHLKLQRNFWWRKQRIWIAQGPGISPKPSPREMTVFQFVEELRYIKMIVPRYIDELC
jgi:hypothetical protein